jgi:hypothetical protein
LELDTIRLMLIVIFNIAFIFSNFTLNEQFKIVEIDLETLNGIGKEREMTLKIIITYMRYLNM